MDTENKKTISPINAQPISEKNNRTTVIITLGVLLLGSIVFGGFELWQNIQKDEIIQKLHLETNSRLPIIATTEPEENNTEINNRNQESPSSTENKWFTVNYGTNAFSKEKCRNCKSDSEYRVDAKYSQITPYDNEKDKEFNVDINKPVVDVFSINYGHDGRILFYIFEDRTAGYTLVGYLPNKGYFTSGIVPELNDVIGFVQGWDSDNRVVFAVLSDGSYYLLDDWIKSLHQD